MEVTVKMIISMAGLGIASAIGEKVLNSFNKPDMAAFVNIAGLCGIGLIAVGIVVKLLQTLSVLG